MRGCGIVNLFTESRKVYEVVLDRAINFELRYSGARPLRDLKTILMVFQRDIQKALKGFLDITLNTI